MLFKDAEVDFYESLKEITDKTDVIDIERVPKEIEIKKKHNNFNKKLNLKNRDFKVEALSALNISSFSSISTNYQKEFLPVFSVFSDTSKNDMFSFPRGFNTGNFMHSLLENLDFTNLSAQKSLIISKLEEFGFNSSKWFSVIYENIETLLNFPLEMGGKEKAKTFFLKDVPNSKKLNEIEFYFSKTDSNFMHGFIDLVFEHKGKFFIIDWKTSYLGGTFEDYNQSSLKKAMENNFYNLQAEIYLSALKKYLKFKTKKENVDDYIGGIFYIFLRGIKKNSFGVFCNKT